MGKRSEGVHNAKQLSFRAGGAFATKKHRRLHFAEYSRTIALLGLTLGAVEESTDWMVEVFVVFLIAGATKPGTLANYRAALTVIHSMAGKDVSNATSSHALKLERRDRSGKHCACPQERFAMLLQLAIELDEGVFHVIRLMRWLGLRMLEALRSGRSLEAWRELILSGNLRLPVTYGSKNGRLRRTEVLEAHVPETLAAIEAALKFCRLRNFELVTGCHNDLESAKSRLKAFFERLPMRGKFASHSLRYRYAVDFANAALDKGIGPVDVLTMLSDRLGHGPSRAKMILDVYCHEIRHRFPPKMKLPADFSPRPRRNAKGTESLPRANTGDNRRGNRVRKAPLLRRPRNIR